MLKRKAARTLPLLAFAIILLASVLGMNFRNKTVDADPSTTNNPCVATYPRKLNKAWVYNGYQYEVFEVRLQADFSEFNLTPGFLDSRTCKPTSDRVIIDGSSLVVSGKKPVGVELGVPNHGAANSKGVWQSNVRSELTPTYRPSVLTETHGRASSAVDDGGRFVLGNLDNQKQQVFCVGIETFVPPPGAINCPPDINTAGSKKGAGALLRQDNCESGTDLGGSQDNGPSLNFNCNDPQLSAWYRNYINDTDLTSFIKTNGDGTLRDFFVHLEARNTQPGGFSVAAIMTFKYPLGYNNVATLDICSGQKEDNVAPGEVICLEPGMFNNGDANGDVTAVELAVTNLSASQISSYLDTEGTQPNGSDPYPFGRGYDSGTMANGEAKPHYWWARTRSPAMASSGWSVQYQPTKFRVKLGTPRTTICFRTLVSPASSGTSYADSGDPICIGIGGPAQEPPEGCSPVMPDPLKEVNLPDQSPNSPLAPNLPFTGTRGDTYFQDVRQNKTKVVDINDISSGGLPVEPDLVTDAIYQKATLNYSPYVKEYPFDTNKPSVTYDSYYTRTTWTSASTPSFYVCDPGWQLVGNGPTCEKYSVADRGCPSGYESPFDGGGYGWLCESRQTDANYDCPTGYEDPYSTFYGYICDSETRTVTHTCPSTYSNARRTGFGWVCSRTSPAPTGVSANPAADCTSSTYSEYVSHSGNKSTCERDPGSKPAIYSCPSGYPYRDGETCYAKSPQFTSATYSCSRGSLVNDPNYGPLCRETTPGTPLYNWSTSSPATRTTRSTTTNTYEMPPCYNRTYDATPTSADGQLTPDVESPTQSSFSGNINVNFGVAEPSKGRTTMRRSSRVDLPYTINYYIERADGSTTGSTDINQSTTIRASSSNKNSSGSDGTSHSFAVSVPGVMQVGDRVCWTLYTTRNSGTSRTTGQMDINGNIQSGSGQRQSSDCTSRVVNQPYTRVYGADVLAGSGFGVGCSINNSASILSWNKGNGAGSGTQLAAQAASTISGFSSASLRGVAPSPPRGLSFGNVSGTYGGNYGSGACTKDYFAFAKPSQIDNSYPQGVGQLNVPAGARQVVYINGDAFIRRNVVYAPGPYTSLSQIPSYYLVVRGNIYISADVTQLDGVYIAQPTASGVGGRIYTCVDPSSRAVLTTSPSAFTTCGKKLTVNGAFLAKQLRLLRTNGSLRDSTVGEATTSGTIAEVFNYSPELFLIDPGLTTTPSRQYDAASALPPVL